MDAKTAKKNETRDWERLGREWAAEGDTEMARVHAKDAKDLRALAAAVKAGNYRRARNIAWRMDTLVRDQIPCRLYNGIYR